MKFKTLMSIKAVICLFFGLGETFIPKILMSLYGASLEPGGIYMAQLFGQAFILIGLLLWLMRNTNEPATVRAFSMSLFIGDMFGFVVSIIAVLNGVVNALGWTTVALYLLIGLGFGYFWLKPPATSQV
jgi:hypothetical protein